MGVQFFAPFVSHSFVYVLQRSVQSEAVSGGAGRLRVAVLLIGVAVQGHGAAAAAGEEAAIQGEEVVVVVVVIVVVCSAEVD